MKYIQQINQAFIDNIQMMNTFSFSILFKIFFSTVIFEFLIVLIDV